MPSSKDFVHVYTIDPVYLLYKRLLLADPTDLYGRVQFVFRWCTRYSKPRCVKIKVELKVEVDVIQIRISHFYGGNSTESYH